MTVQTVQYVSGAGLQYPGIYCKYDPNVGACVTRLVTYTSGTGFKPYTATTAANLNCPTGTFVGYDDTGKGFTTYTISTAARCLAAG